jgi:N-methylhydantoinase B
VIAPEGSIFNPIFPVAAEARFGQIQRIVDLIIKALAPVIPERVVAGSSATLSFAAYSGVRPSGDYWVFLEVNEGAYGGRPHSDGPDSIDELMRNTRNNPVEDLAMHLPLICDRYELRDDVCSGAGRFRGGLGVVKVQRFLGNGFMTHECDRHDDAPWGFMGGHAGAGGKVETWSAAKPAEVRSMPAKFSGLQTTPGDCIAIYSPNGGGYGDPLERPAERVRDDVLDGFYTRDYAFDAYGVVLRQDLSLDEAATETRRREMRRSVA